MKINWKILSIPPYISTSWEHVLSLQLEQLSGNLVITLKNGSKISIPNLSGETIEEVFNAHSEFLEHQNRHGMNKEGGQFSIGFGMPGMGPMLMGDGMLHPNQIMQHDPNQKDAPDLPPEILDKIVHMTKSLGIDLNSLHLPEGEPHCNCPYCQIAKAMHASTEPPLIPDVLPNASLEEKVDDTELKFREWDIKKIGDQLYEVTNPFDSSEHYQVFLGNPIGCTCGKNNCNHIVAVLES